MHVGHVRHVTAAPSIRYTRGMQQTGGVQQAGDDEIRPDPRLLTWFILRSLILLPFFFIALIPGYFKYKTLRYRFDDQGIGMRWGLLWRREIHLTYTRIQDIHVSRGLLERWLGLATIQIQTAAGSSSAEMSLIGFTDYAGLRDFLYSKMRGARTDVTAAAAAGALAASPVAPQHYAPSPATATVEEVAVLGQILAEVRALRAELTPPPAPPAGGATPPPPPRRTGGEEFGT